MSKESIQQRWAFLFPGQGAQYPSMGRDFFETFAIAKETFQEADDILGEAFSRLIFEGTSAELTLTKNSQVAIFIVSAAIARTVKEQFPSIHPFVCAGLSLGEYTALVAAGRISFAECLELVSLRAAAMHEACECRKGTMHVVLGLNEESVAEVLGALQPNAELWIANLNCPEQVVIAGAQEKMAPAIDALKEKGAKRVLPLDVSGAFHSKFMLPAQEKLAPKIATVPLYMDSIELVMNVPGDFVKDLASIRHYLFEQVVSPVRWEKGIRAMMAQPVDVYLEMGPGKSLSGMNKRIGTNKPTLSVEKVPDLEQLAKYVEAYAVTEC
jgi:[acyl-carrier-protein] S-malonyltransferase